LGAVGWQGRPRASARLGDIALAPGPPADRARVAGGVRTGPRTVALVERARVRVRGAGRTGRVEAVVCRLVADAHAFGASGARVAGVRARAARARVRPVTEEAVVAGCRVVRVDAGATPVAVIIGADVAVARAPRRHGVE